MSVNKYGNRTVAADGQVFDSKHEYHRWIELKYMERVGLIKNLERQVPYELIPAQRKDGRVIERACKYIADFAYQTQDGKEIVEDAKGYRTDVYKIKKKLMLQKYGIEIQEV